MSATKQQKARMRELDDVKIVMSTENGRRFLWRHLVESGIYVCSYTPGQQSDHTAFREGQRNSGLRLMEELQQASPELFLTMMEENRNEIVERVTN